MLRDELRDHLGVVRLLDEVELAAQVHLQLVRERRELKQLRGLGMPLERPRRRAHELEVELDRRDDPGAAHLDADPAAALQQRGVDLRDRRGRERLGVDLREVLEADVLRDDRPDPPHRGIPSVASRSSCSSAHTAWYDAMSSATYASAPAAAR